MTQELETRTVRTVFLRLMPLLMACYLLAYLDRINIGFAAVTMNHDLGLDAYHYGLGAGLFFWGYFFFEVPSNLMLARFGARRWIARIMVTWGLVSMGTAFIQGWVGFLALRFILGIAEAGLFPGVILYLTYWFPAAYRARIIAAFMVAIPLSLAVGSPISTAILAMGGIAGFKGWQWLFLIEGAPTILLAVIVLLVLPDRPRDARWLTADQKQWLEETLDREQKAVEAKHGMSFWRTFIDARVLGLSFIYFANLTTNLGLAFFLPQMIKEIGFGTFAKWSGDLDTVCHRSDRRSALGLLFGPIQRASDQLVPRAGGLGDWTRRRRVPGQHTRRRNLDVGGRDRHLWSQGAVLASAVDVPDRKRGCGWHRPHQFRRQPGRVCRTLHYGLGERCDRQLQSRALRPRWVWYRGRCRYVDGRKSSAAASRESIEI